MSRKTEEMLSRVAEKIVYPPTPEIKFPVQKQEADYTRGLRLAAAILLVGLILLSLLAIPSVRAAIADIFQIGGAEIRIGEKTPVPNATLSRLMTLAGKTTLEKAQAQVKFPLWLPEELPDEVFVQDWAGQMVVMVWRDENDIKMALYQFDDTNFGFYKGAEDAVVTSVNGNIAIWIERPHVLWFKDEKVFRPQEVYFVEGHVLIWEENGVTYRLESGLSMNEAIKIAENPGTFLPQEGSTDSE